MMRGGFDWGTTNKSIPNLPLLKEGVRRRFKKEGEKRESPPHPHPLPFGERGKNKTQSKRKGFLPFLNFLLPGGEKIMMRGQEVQTGITF